MAGRQKNSCDAACGCPIPCTGGELCKCATGVEASGAQQHAVCECGRHCSCNPCTSCGMTATGLGVGGAQCTCIQSSCSCRTCMVSR